MNNQSNKKPIDEIYSLLKELKKDITELQTDVSYIKKRVFADHIEKQLKPKEEPPKEVVSSSWFW